MATSDTATTVHTDTQNLRWKDTPAPEQKQAKASAAAPVRVSEATGGVCRQARDASYTRRSVTAAVVHTHVLGNADHVLTACLHGAQ